MIIKKKLIFIATIMLLFSIGGCKDNFLRTIPEGQLSTATFWKTEQDARLAVNKLYTHLHGTSIFPWDAMSDIGHSNGSVGGEAQNEQGLQDAGGNGYGTGQWYNLYRGVRACNEFLANVTKVQTDNQELINRFKAEARFIRAYHYMYLAMFFGDVPLIKDLIGIKEGAEVTRTDAEQVWDFVGKELDEISSDLPLSYDSANLGRITRGAALALKARTMLWAGRYSEAAQAAKATIDLGVYSLYPSYESLFTYQAEHNSEVILNKEFLKNDKPNHAFRLYAPFSQVQISGRRYIPTKNIVDAYEMKNGRDIDEPNSGFDPRNPYENRDPRLHYSIYVLGDTLPDGRIYDPRPGFGGPDDISKGIFSTTSTGFDVQKYVNPQDLGQPFNSGINIILIRYAEVLLTYAEAKIEIGDIDQSVYDAINEVRQRPDVDIPPIQPPKSQDELRKIVRHERMVELAFEGHRYFDIRRWKIAPEVMNGPIKGMTYEDKNGELQTVVFGGFERHFSAPRDYLLPIPQKELELNPNLEQNPGY